MGKYYCKCGRSYQKYGDSDTTGHHLQDYGPEHECFGCPFVLELKESYSKPVIKGYECRVSKYIRYDSTARLSVGDRNVGKIYSLDFDFLHRVRDFSDNLDGVEPDRYAFSSRPSDYCSDGRYTLTVYPTQNKAGILAKQQIRDKFFDADGARKDMTPVQEKELVFKTISSSREETQAMNTYFAPCGQKFKRACNGAQQTTIEVTGNAYSLNCFSCPHGRTESSDGPQGPKVFCACSRAVPTNDSFNKAEVNKMGKLNLANISAGINQVKSVAESLANVSHYELIPLEYIRPAEHNAYAENDTDESRYEVAMSIQANGLLEPLVVNKKTEDNFTLIAGEHRFTAIKQYLPDQFKKVSCMVFEGLTDDEAQLKLHEANRQREYTPEQKFKHYMELDELLHRMKDSGNYHGPIQKGIAELLGVSTRQIRKYQTVTQLSPDIRQAVIQGNLSINDACRTLDPQPDAISTNSDESESPVPESGTGSAFVDNQPAAEASDTPDTEQRHLTNMKITSAIKQHYLSKQAELLLFYLFQVPTTQEAIHELKPPYGYSGGTITFENGSFGDCTATLAHVEISWKGIRETLSYSQVDALIREMIRSGTWLPEDDVKKLVLKHIHGRMSE